MLKKLKNTRQRTAIIDIIKNSDMPISAEEIHSRLEENGHTVGLATIYRNLESLSKSNILSKVKLRQDKCRYEINQGGHSHFLVCLNCDTVVKIKACPVAHALEGYIKKETSFDIIGHSLEMYGYCAHCSR